MSYDLHLFPLLPGETVEHALDRVMMEDERDDIGPPVPEKENRKQALASALIRNNPTLEPFEFEHAKIAKTLNTSEEEARLQYRHIELNGPEDKGVQITLYDDSATITVPYWHSGQKAEAVFRDVVRPAIAVMQREADYVTYDPQIERVVNDPADFAEMLSTYCRVSEQLDNELVASTGEKKPWWKFW